MNQRLDQQARDVAESVARRSAVHRVPAGTLLFSERQPCSGFPLVLSGRVRVAQRYPNGREMQLYRVGPGDACVLSSSCLLGRSQYPASGIAETEQLRELADRVVERDS